MLEGVPDAISASAYGLGSDRVREPSVSYLSTRTRGAGHQLDPHLPRPSSPPLQRPLNAFS
jgi:hypothetical protein